MPNISALAVGQPPNLIEVWWGDGRHAAVTLAEAQAFVDSHPSWTNARLEDWAVQQMDARWTGHTDTIYVHIVTRSPLVVMVMVTDPGVVVPPDWWAG